MRTLWNPILFTNHQTIDFYLEFKTKWFVNNIVSHNVRTHCMYHVCVLRIGLKMVP